MDDVRRSGSAEACPGPRPTASAVGFALKDYLSGLLAGPGAPGIKSRLRLNDTRRAGTPAAPPTLPRIAGFENPLIFYRVTVEAIEVIRVRHGARDIESILSEE